MKFEQFLVKDREKALKLYEIAKRNQWKADDAQASGDLDTAEQAAFDHFSAIRELNKLKQERTG